EITVISLSIELLQKLDSERIERQRVADVIYCGISLMNHLITQSASFIKIVDTKGEATDRDYKERFDSMSRQWQELDGAARSAGLDLGELHTHFLEFRNRFSASRQPKSSRVTMEDFSRRAEFGLSLIGLIGAAEMLIFERVEELGEKEASELEIHRRMVLLLIGALVLSVLLSLTLCFLVGKMIIARVAVVRENTQRFAEGRELLPPIVGEDEIAFLDRNFRKMADLVHEAAERDRAILENSVDVICAMGADLGLLRISDSARALWGVEPGAAAGTSIAEIISPSNIAESLEHFEQARQQSPTVVTFENETLSASGEGIASLWSVRWSNEDAAFLCVVHDLRERKYAEAQRQELMALVSHDLRTPLTTAMIALDSLLTDSGTNLDDSERSEIAGVHASLDYVVSLVSDLLDLLKIQEGRLELELMLVSVSRIDELLSKYLEARSMDCRLVVKADKSKMLLIDEHFLPRVVTAIVRHSRLAWGDGPVKIGIDEDRTGEKILLWIEPDRREGLVETARAGSIAEDSESARRISMAVSLALCEEIGRMLQGELAISWDSRGLPLYMFRLPLAVLQ
ncbi:MAG: PAS domain S-box protein, partial [Cyanobacteria bacterium HKST-UBA02]|nr:PAS domain S-box protein [Cyanobacteria bacterium HKST-UBA02]